MIKTYFLHHLKNNVSLLKIKKDCQKEEKRTKKVISSEMVISTAKDLLGKLISHVTDREEDGGCKWVKRIVLKICDGSLLNPKFEIKPINSDSIYVSNLYSDFQNSEVEVCDITENDFINATIDHLLLMIFQRKIHGGELRW